MHCNVYIVENVLGQQKCIKFTLSSSRCSVVCSAYEKDLNVILFIYYIIIIEHCLYLMSHILFIILGYRNSGFKFVQQ
jgi:hypothetical protein